MIPETLDLTRTFLSAFTRSIACLNAASCAAYSSPSMKMAPVENCLSVYYLNKILTLSVFDGNCVSLKSMLANISVFGFL